MKCYDFERAGFPEKHYIIQFNNSQIKKENLAAFMISYKRRKNPDRS